jgi:asparagine N-glycosylation enzyme membrane subunit Stt3
MIAMTASDWVKVTWAVGLTISVMLIMPDPGLRQTGVYFLVIAAIAIAGYALYQIIARTAEIKKRMRQAFSEKDV